MLNGFRLLPHFSAVAVVFTSINLSLGSEPPVSQDHPAEPILVRGIEVPRGPKCGRYAEDGCERSGWPDCIGRFAKCSVTSDHSVGYVGGSTVFFWGEPRKTHEGTFGLDYSGHWFSRKVWLLWSHGHKEQGGAGAYASDGPRILPEK
ncbi:MAG: hypothetical protein SGI77_22925 [Pirellulaceae bacterium]|nr:hypothetical protein [Pirellulaceae bacterium]